MYTEPVFPVNADGTPVADPIIDFGASGGRSETRRAGSEVAIERKHLSSC